MSDDKDLELSIDDASLALGSDDSLSQTAPLDEGMDLDFAGDLDLGGDLISEDSDEATSLKLGDDVELGGDVLAKLAEIDEIMEADATSASIHPSTLSALDPSDLSLSDEDTVGSSVFLGGDLDSSSDDELVLGDGDVLGGMDLDADEIEETRVAPLPTAKPAAKKSPPIAPSLESDEVGEELSFGTNANELEVPKKVASSSERSPEERSGYEDVKGHYNHELERLQATLNHLRTDRSELLKKIEELEEYKIGHSRQTLGMRAELDEKKIEVQLLKRRLSEESSDLKYQLDLETERRKLAEERAKAYQAEVAAVQQKVKLEVKKVSSREKELEQKLELLKTDAESQIRHRDQKILELKRRMDAMEFDMDAMNAIEQKTVGDKHELESKLDKAIKTLRTAIGILETDDPKLATLEKLKKNLEV